MTRTVGFGEGVAQICNRSSNGVTIGKRAAYSPPVAMATASPAGLSSYHHWISRIETAWPRFQARRLERLAEGRRYGGASEKVAEDIVGDLLTEVLGWAISDLNHQVKYCDILVTQLGVRRLIIETKRPGWLTTERAVDTAFLQARGYAEALCVDSVGVSDGVRLLAHDLLGSGRVRSRVDAADLSIGEPDLNLWWLSPDGIYREPGPLPHPAAWAPPEAGRGKVADDVPGQLHPKYHLPVICFAYVGSVNDPHTWHLPYLEADGAIDHSRLPKAIQAVLSNYRGARVTSLPEEAIPSVLEKLAAAARRAGKMPPECLEPAAIYVQLSHVLLQLTSGSTSA